MVNSGTLYRLSAYIAFLSLVFIPSLSFAYSSVPVPTEATRPGHTIGQTWYYPENTLNPGNAGGMFYSYGESFSAISIPLNYDTSVSGFQYGIRIFSTDGSTSTPLINIVASSTIIDGSTITNNAYNEITSNLIYTVFTFPSTVNLLQGYYFLEVRRIDGFSMNPRISTIWKTNGSSSDAPLTFSARFDSLGRPNSQRFDNDLIFYTGTGSPPYAPLPYQPADIVSFSPHFGSTTATTSVNLSVTLYNDGTYNETNLTIANYSTGGFVLNISENLPLVQGTTTVDFGTYDLTIGNWFGSVSIYSDTQMTQSENVAFNVVQSTTSPFGIVFPTYSASTTEDIQSMCYGVDGILGMLCKIPEAILEGIKSLFIPSDVFVSLMSGLKDDIQTKPPFGYVAVSIQQMDLLTASSTGLYALSNENNIATVIFDPIKNVLSILLYVMGGIGLFMRVRHIDL